MKVHLPLMIQDPMTDPFSNGGDDKIFEGIHIEPHRDYVGDFKDGPATSIVVVEDFDPATGARLPGAKFVPPGRGRKMGRYQISKDIYSPEFIQASVLGAILKTMRLFSDENALGRPIEWAFDHPQLVVRPRAGEDANAFYDRDTRSLQFFYFKNPNNPDQTVYTSLSRDIVAHETGHAIIDGIAPGLYDAITPQSLAIHESMADLTAVITAFASNTLRRRVLERTRGSIRNSTEFSSLAPEFGKALDRSGRARALRSLWNRKTLNPRDRTLDERGHPNFVKSTEPHDLSEVLSGALYTVMVQMHESDWKEHGGEFSYSGRALADSLRRFQRLVFRAVDFLPPGDVSFADYGRAVNAAESSMWVSGWGKEGKWLGEEFKRRHVVRNERDLDDHYGGGEKFKRIEPEVLLKSRREAHAFVDRHRKLFNIPPRVSLNLDQRFKTDKRRGSAAEDWMEGKEELLMKVSWEETEEDVFDARFPRARSVTCGRTLVFDWGSSKLQSVLSPDFEVQRPERDRMVRTMLESGLLRRPEDDQDTDPRSSPLRTQARKGVLKIAGAGRLLHFHRKT